MRARVQAPCILAVQRELELALAVAVVRVADRRPPPAVPDDHVAGAVLAVRDMALELRVLERVVLGVHREPLLVRIEARAARHRPALEHAVELEPQVVVQATRSMTLDHEDAARRRNGAAVGLGRATKLRLRR